jgi:WD40 repeat protein
MLALSPRGTAVAGAQRFGTSVGVWDTAAGREVARLNDLEELTAVAFVSERQLLLCDKQRCLLWDMRSGRQQPFWGEGDPAWEGSTGIFAAAVAPGQKAVAVSAGQPVLVLDYPPGSVRHRLNLLRGTTAGCLAFSPTGRYLAAECWNEADRLLFVGLWDARRGKCLRLYEVPDSLGISALAFRPDGRALAVGADRRISLFETSSEEELAGFRPPAEGLAAALRFSLDGGTLAAMLPEGRCLLLDARSGRVRKTLAPPDRGLEAVIVTPDGAVAAGAGAGTLVVWSIPPP